MTMMMNRIVMTTIHSSYQIITVAASVKRIRLVARTHDNYFDHGDIDDDGDVYEGRTGDDSGDVHDNDTLISNYHGCICQKN